MQVLWDTFDGLQDPGCVFVQPDRNLLYYTDTAAGTIMTIDLTRVDQFGGGVAAATARLYGGLGSPGWMAIGETAIGQSFPLTWPAEGTTLYNGSAVPIVWDFADAAAAAADTVRLELLLEHTIVHTIGVVPNNGSYNWVVPSGLQQSDRYRIFLRNTLSRFTTGISVLYITIAEQSAGEWIALRCAAVHSRRSPC